MHSNALLAALLAASPAPPSISPGRAAAPVVAVLSSDAKPYWEAFEGFQRELGVPVTVLQMREGALRLPSEAALVVAFGGRAAQQSYPPGVRLVYCLSPGKSIPAGEYEHPPVQIHMTGDAELLVSRMIELQPGARRVAVLWSQAGSAHEVEDLRLAAKGRVEFLSMRVRGAEELYEALRGLKGVADALWMAPDPVLVNADNIETLREFSWANAVPFYCPTEGLVEKGASASISVGYAEIGRTAAMVVRDILAGLPVSGELHPQRVSVTFSAASAKRAGLVPSAEALKRIEHMRP